MEAYAKTIGQVAAGTVIVGVGIFALFATDGIGGLAFDVAAAGGDAAITGGSTSKEESSSKKKKKNLLLCKECVERQ